MDTVDKLVIFYDYSTKRRHDLDTWIDDVTEGETATATLKELFGTRWVSRQDAFQGFFELHEAMVNTLFYSSLNVEPGNCGQWTCSAGCNNPVTVQFIVARNAVCDVCAVSVTNHVK